MNGRRAFSPADRLENNTALPAAEDIFGAIGMAVVSDQASAAGIASLPTPITESESDLWYLWKAFGLVSELSVAGGVNSMTFEFDSKAQRKVGDGEDLVTVVENGSATTGLGFLIQFRELIKTH